MAKLKGLISKKNTDVYVHPLEKATTVSYDAFDAFRAAQTGLAESNAILSDFTADQEAYIASIQDEIAAAKAQEAKNNALAAKLAEFTG